jgi:uncharacterized protein (TIGR03000 family)
MRKILVILALSVATVAAITAEASAQGLFRGRRGLGIGANSYYGSGYYGNGYYNQGFGNGFGTGYYNNGFYSPGYGTNYYNGYYSPGYNTSYNSVPYYNGTQYYNTNPINSVPSSPIIRQSAYSEPAPAQQSASVIVRVPQADAKVWFDGSATSQQGMERAFHSPPLQPGGSYTYTIRSTWMDNGKTIERERNVQVQPGQTVTVDFRNASAEDLQSPPRVSQ